jgi:hypothetical protein
MTSSEKRALEKEKLRILKEKTEKYVTLKADPNFQQYLDDLHFLYSDFLKEMVGSAISNKPACENNAKYSYINGVLHGLQKAAILIDKYIEEYERRKGEEEKNKEKSKIIVP